MNWRVAAFPRSGTLFTAKLLQCFSYDVGHDEMGDNGMCHWLAAVPGLSFGMRPGKPYSGNPGFAQLMHLTRDPYKVISSAHHCEPFLGHIRRWLGIFDNSIAGTALAWVAWNGIIEAQKPIYRFKVEEAEAFLLGCCGGRAPTGKKPPTDCHSMPHPDIDPATLPESVHFLRERYGYK